MTPMAPGAAEHEVLAPDARLCAPKRALPRGAIDCHAHVFDRFDRYAFAGERKYSPPPCPREAWLALHAALGVARGVQVNGSPYGFDNSITADFLREHPGRFVGVAMIGPRTSDAELRKLDAAGIRAARLMDQFPTGATTAMLEEVARRVAPLGWHIEINIERSSDWVALEPRLRKCPVPLVFDHMGRVRGSEGVNAPGFAAVRRLLAERDDCWTKISSWYRLSDSGPPRFDDMRVIIQTLLRERPDRCVWGTNWPHPGLTKFMPNDADLLDQLESWLPGAAMREALFVTNAEKLYRFV
jgi:predicted TIM-barrel fold metal-dependent hydrolase